MAKRRERKMKWRNFVFTPRDADPATHGIRHRDDGFLYLCLRLRNGDYLREYDVRDAKFRPGDGGRNVATDWTGFDQALRKHEAMNPTPPSVFSGRYQHSEEGNQLRSAMLRAIVREYQHPEALADDLWAWLQTGKPDEAWNFIRLLALHWNEAREREKAESAATHGE